MRRAGTEIVAWESRWAAPVATVTFLAVALLLGSNLANQVSGTGDAEILRSAHEHSGSVMLTGLMQALAFLLLAAPLFYLFKVVSARSDRVRSQLVGLVVIAPLFLAISGGLTIAARGEAADQFVAGEAKSTLSAREAGEKCRSEQKEEGAKAFAEEFEPAPGETALAACERRKVEDDEASNAIAEASLAPIVSGLGIAGGLGFVIALFYSGLWAMRTGIMTRLWASLGMAAGVAFLLGPLFVITLLWFVYFGLLVLGRVPGGRPPAWAAGEAIPWPTPGEKAAAELEPADPDLAEPPSATGDGDSSDDGGERRKRKQRD
jgi:hypothetical protein